MREFNLKNRIGWGNEIHLETQVGKYAGSGRCLLNEGGIVYKLPTIEELRRGKLRASGHCSSPYVKVGDYLVYESDAGEEIKLKFNKVRYCHDPHDLFFADLLYFPASKASNLFLETIKTIKNYFKKSTLSSQ